MNEQERVKYILDNIFLRYSAKGHIRFSLPPVLCSENSATFIERGLAGKRGIYRVKVFKEDRKLSLRFDDAITNLKDIGIALRDIIIDLDKETLSEDQAAVPFAPKQAERAEGAHRFKALWDGLKEKLTPVRKKEKPTLSSKLLSSIGISITEKTEKSIIAVINDIVIFYLIKTHWHIITDRLLKRPFKNIKEWLTLFYLVFLYVRHKKQAGHGK